MESPKPHNRMIFKDFVYVVGGVGIRGGHCITSLNPVILLVFSLYQCLFGVCSPGIMFLSIHL